MRLAGDANWWAPKPLRRFYERFGLKEVVDEPPAAGDGDGDGDGEGAQLREPVSV